MFEDFAPKKNGSHMALHEYNSGDKSGREMFASRGKIDTACY